MDFVTPGGGGCENEFLMKDNSDRFFDYGVYVSNAPAGFCVYRRPHGMGGNNRGC